MFSSKSGYDLMSRQKLLDLKLTKLLQQLINGTIGNVDESFLVPQIINSNSANRFVKSWKRIKTNYLK